jgi:hypothetical protein
MTDVEIILKSYYILKPVQHRYYINDEISMQQSTKSESQINQINILVNQKFFTEIVKLKQGN